MSESADERLADYFSSGVEPEDVTALYALRRAQVALQAFTTLFHGTEAAVLVRLLVLREAASRGQQPFWTPSELRDRLAFLDEAKLENIITRLRGNGILAWDPETSLYSVSPVGRLIAAAISTLLKFHDEGSELGYIASQLAASGVAGRVSEEELQHLLSRLNELKNGFDRAILSGSEARIRSAEQRLGSAWRWVDKGTEVLRAIMSSGDLEPAAHGVAQRIGEVQSSLLSISGSFQRTLAKLEQQKVHLGRSGLSSSDVQRWLRGLSRSELADLTQDAVSIVPRVSFLVPDLLLDATEYELMDRERPERLKVELPPPEAPVDGSHLVIDQTDYKELEQWYGALAVAPDGLPLNRSVPLRDFQLSSYRLSLLALIGQVEPAAIEGPVAALARLDRAVTWSGQTVAVGEHEVEEMSEGYLNHVNNPHG